MPYKLALVMWMTGLLMACGGGGSGGSAGGGSAGGGSTPTLTSFVKFSAITVPGVVTVKGYSQEAAYTYDTIAQKVGSLSTVTPFASGATYEADYKTGSSPGKVILTSALGTRITIDTALGDVIAPQTGMIIHATANGENYALTPTLANFGWDYQNFAVWTTGGGTGKGAIGVNSVGAETPSAALPTSGTHTYVGLCIGHYVDAAGAPLYAVATVFATVDFGTKSIAFSSTGTNTIQPITGASVYNNNLNINGTLAYEAGANQFRGAVTSPGGGPDNAAMTDMATVKFFGSAAQELGGTFSLSRGGVVYIGAFGGKIP